MIYRSLIFSTTILFLSSIASVHAVIPAPPGSLGDGVKGWCTTTTPGAEECFSNPYSACIRQHEIFAPSNAFIGYKPFGPLSKVCSWARRPSTILPGPVIFRCTDLNYKRVPPARCVPHEQLAEERKQCSSNSGGSPNPTGGTNPVLLTTGAKYETETDYTSADNRLQIKRHYRSFQTGSNNVYHDESLGAGIGWRFSFSYELHIQNVSFSIAPFMTLYMPDGTSYDFRRAPNGSITPIDGDAGQTPVKLRFVGNWPSDLNQVTNNPTQWELTLPDNRTVLLEGFQPSGQTEHAIARPIKISSLDGYLQTFQYDSINALQQISDSLGRTLIFSWLIKDPAAIGEPSITATPLAIDKITLPDNSSIKYGYGTIATIPSGNNVTPPTDRLITREHLSTSGQSVGTRTYHYEDTRFPIALTGITDERGIRAASWSYDANGRAIESKAANNQNRYTINYTDSNFSAARIVTNPLGKQTTYHFFKQNEVLRLTDIDGATSPNCVATTRNIAYDSQGYVQSSTDEEGNVTRYQYDSQGRPLSVTEAFGTAETRTTTTIWHATLRLPISITTPNLKTDFFYDNQNRLIQRTETDITAHTAPYQTNGQQRIWKFTYTTQGLIDTVDGPLPGIGDTVDYDYDANGFVQKITNEVGHVTDITSVDQNGLPLTLIDPNGIATNLEYDARRRINKITVQPGSKQAVTIIEYDGIGQITKITNPDGSFLNYQYDNSKRPTDITNNRNEHISYSYDNMGNIINTSISDSKGTLRYTQARTYDELGRILKIIDANADETVNQYDKAGNLINIVDPRNNAYSYAFDGLNRIISETDPDNLKTKYVLNPNDETDSVEDARTNITSYVRNGWGDPILIDSPDTGITVYIYNELGLVTQSTDARGVLVQMNYDDSGRQINQIYPGNPAENIIYSYDKGNNGVGRLTRINDQSGIVDYIYDARGNLIREKRRINGQIYITRYSYNKADFLTRIIYPSDRRVIYRRNNIGQITKILTQQDATASTIVVAQNIAYMPFGPNKRIKMANGLNINRIYNQNYQLIRLITKNGTTNTQKLTYKYDPAGNITKIRDIVNPTRNQVYNYDRLDRLQSAGGLYGQIDYQYDEVGNRTLRTVQQGNSTTEIYNIEASSNRLSDITTGGNIRTFQYSANGNTIDDSRNNSGGFTFTYNERNRLEQVDSTQGTVASYIYNAQGQRITADHSGQKTHYIYNRDGQIIAEINDSGTTSQEYIWLGDIPIALVTGVNSTSPALYYIHADHLKTPRQITNSSKSIVWDLSSYPFGQTYSVQGSQSLNIRFPGQYLDTQTGLLYNWNRYYDSTTGRYIASDPIGLDGGLNTYGYALQNPISFTDPEGLNPLLGAVAVAGRITPLLGRLSSVGLRGSGLRNFSAIASEAANAENICSSSTDQANTIKPAKPDADPDDFCEQLALAEAKAGAYVEIIDKQLGDTPRLTSHYGPGPWEKRRHKHICFDGRELIIHYFHSRASGKNVELKFKKR